MEYKKIIQLAFIGLVCLLIFNKQSQAQNNAQIAKDKMTTANSWDSAVRTVDTTPTTTTIQVTGQVQSNSPNRTNFRDNADPQPTQIPTTYTANVKKALKPPVKPAVNVDVSKNQQTIDNVKANIALNRSLPTQQQIRDLILEKKSN